MFGNNIVYLPVADTKRFHKSEFKKNQNKMSGACQVENHPAL